MDNHGSRVKIGAVTISAFSFQRAFKFVRTHICTPEPLSGNARKDISLLYNSLQHGRCYAAMEYFRPARGFSFTITQNKEECLMGDSLVLEDKAELRVSLPASALVRIIRDGALLAEETNKEITLSIGEKGVYRVEAYLKRYWKYRPWIFSNPIFVK